MTPKVLVYCPTRPHAPRVHPLTAASIEALNWPGTLQIVFDRDDSPAAPGYQDITTKYNRARQMALRCGYDALFTVEADMVIPPEALDRLAAIDGADVAHGLYCSRHSTRKWLAFTSLSPAVTLADDPYTARELWGRVVDTVGVGLGCTLIWRKALEAIPFELRYGGPACDWWFAEDCAKLGFSTVHDLGVVCGHITGNAVIWPDKYAERLYREESI